MDTTKQNGWNTDHLFPVKTAEHLTLEDLPGFQAEPKGRMARKSNVRVMFRGEDEGVEVFVYTDDRCFSLDWSARLTASTPVEVIRALLAKVLP